MRICEICGTEEGATTAGQEQLESVILHICESCREDRINPTDTYN